RLGRGSSGARVWRSSDCPTDRLGRNSFAERWVGTARRELLDNLLIFGRRHLEYMLQEFLEHCEEARPHQGLGQRTPPQRAPTQASETGPVLHRACLGGVLHEYFRAGLIRPTPTS